ncbi:hypothetical protein EON65_40810 [archaeon]|nr:MAG: hypothetical protein EON65_40810 [archaeon]
MEDNNNMKEAIQDASRECRSIILQAAENLIRQDVLLNESAIAGSNVTLLTDVIMEQRKGTKTKSREVPGNNNNN